LCAVGHVGSDGIEAPVYTRESNLVQPPANAISWADLCAAHSGRNGATSVRQITLRFLTPTMLKADSALVRRPTFATILKRLRDRINALSYFYCGNGLDIDFKAFGEQAEGIKTVADSTRWVESTRYSRRREVTHDLSGFIGEVSFEGELAPFIPYLKLGEYVHVGKNAVFGNGWYRIESMG
jgi:CRISPR-associated endoribonuclease Cas6